MNDLYGVLTVIAAYPVHILTFVGCILLLVLVLPKRMRKGKHFSISPESSAKKTEFTQSEKHLLAEKINENRMSNLKKTSTSSENAKFMIFGAIVLIGLTILFVLGMILLKFQKY